MKMSKTLPFSLRVPVVAAPMFLVSGPELVLAACKAGIVGAFPTPNARPIDVLESWMQQITGGLERMRDEQPEETIGPWCANLVTHSSNTRLPEDLRLIAKYKPPIVVTALGSPKPAIEVVQGYGGLVVADVINMTLARKAAAAGADGLACVSAGAGGHTGFISPLPFVSAVREFFDGLVIIGGGISDGWGVAGAIAAGADLVYMGTRFIPTTESMASPEYKQMLVDSSLDDLIVSSALTGTTATRSWAPSAGKKSGLQAKEWAPSGPWNRWARWWTVCRRNTAPPASAWPCSTACLSARKDSALPPPHPANRLPMGSRWPDHAHFADLRRRSESARTWCHP